MTALLVAGVVAVVGIAIYAAWQMEQKRTAAMRQAAQAMGFTFTDRDDAVLARPFPAFDRGSGRQARNVMTGRSGGRPAALFDHQYTIRSGKNNTTHRQTVVVFDGFAGLPDFSLGPEHFFHKIATALGYQDIDFDEHPEFSQHYLLRGADEAAIRAVFNTDVLAFLSQERGWTVQSVGGAVAVLRANRRCDPGQAPAFLADSLRIASKLSRA
jgi:hypothetical protein